MERMLKQKSIHLLRIYLESLEYACPFIAKIVFIQNTQNTKLIKSVDKAHI